MQTKDQTIAELRSMQTEDHGYDGGQIAQKATAM